ncbi:tetratricopeptide repeat-containing sensor histidine kinase [Pseudochryseolinea flava]|uniref:histidine kinase n=1 Tax=Pseudochryseolinea flava TaxID=2059302 RepID=A0A364Y459_9BACT|nr:sensor histidine kinase [Pseudochryseolinea flava]RAW01603.1 hypothetical protein DQQ10_08060 [Pseudochryseolinea flava]
MTTPPRYFRISIIAAFCALFFWGHLCSAQNIYSLGDERSYITALEKQATQSTNDSVRAYTWLRLSLLMRRVNDIDKSKHFLTKGRELGARYPFINAAAVYYNAIIQFASSDMVALEKELLRADSMLSHFENPESNKLRGILWNNYGIIQQMKSDEKAAMDAFTQKAVVYAAKSGDATVLGKAYKAIAIVFMNANQRVNASAYLVKAIKTTEGLSDDNPISLTELVDTYIVAGENYANLEQTDSANIVLSKAENILNDYPTSNLYLSLYHARGVTYHKTKQYDLAITTLDKGIALATKLQSFNSLNRLKYAKFKSLSNKNEHHAAGIVLKDLIKSPMVFVTDKKIYYKDLFTTYSKLGDSKEAVLWATRYINVSDSLYEAKFQKDIIELEKKYRESENQKQIATLQTEKEKASLESRNSRLLNWLLATIILFLSASGFFVIALYRNSKRLSQQKDLHYQQQIQDVEQKQQIQLTRALMQGEEMERKRLAIDLHDGLGGRLAGIKINLSRIVTGPTPVTTELEKVIEQLDVSSNELRRIARNMMPESLLKVGLTSSLKDMCDLMSTVDTQVVFQSYSVSEALPQEIQVHTYRIVQELLTNALRHAHAKQVLVQCSQNENVFFLTIEDNGSGFDIGSPQGKGIGLTSIRNRVEYLKGKLDIASSSQGTTVNIEIYTGHEQ